MDVFTYKCPNCDGPLEFLPQMQQFHCNYCASDFNREVLIPAAAEQTVEEVPASAAQEIAGAAVYSCPSCGAEVATDETTAATFCYYCHNPVILSGRLDGELAPDVVIPFAIDKKQAIDRFLGWVQKKRFVPRAFFSKKQIEAIAGVYFPYWLVDCDVQASMEARATQVRSWRTGDVQNIETKYFMVMREGALHFADISKNALRKANRKLAESVQPFDMNGLQAFSPAYLAGFQAEKRDIAQQDLLGEIQNEVHSYAKDLLSQTVIGYSSVTPTSVLADITGSKWRYALLPVWVLTYKGRDQKMFYYAMNGQTGKVCGELPVDFKRLLLLFLGIAVPLLLILSIGGYLL